MDRDRAHREVLRLIAEYRDMPFATLLELANGPLLETDYVSSGDLVTLTVDIRSASDDAVRIYVSAYGNNWWKFERVEESILIQRRT